jgi:ribokinase
VPARIVVVGSANTDMVVKVPRLPGPGETVIGGEFVIAAGGKGANQAVACARAGATVSFVARVGADDFGRNTLRGLKREGVSTRYVLTDRESPSGVALIFVDEEGENIIAVAPGANMRLTPEDVEAAHPAITGADCLLLQLEVPLPAVERAVRIARQAGVLVLLNPAPAPSRPFPARLLKQVDVLTPNRSEAAALVGRPVRTLADARAAARKLCDLGPARVVITLGKDGALAQELIPRGKAASPSAPAARGAAQPVHLPACLVQAVDAVAAGDAFSGALAVALSEGMPFLEACRFANAAGACAVTKLGAQPSMPSRREIEAMLGPSAG